LARALLVYGCQGCPNGAGDPKNGPSDALRAPVNVSPELRQPPRDKDADGLSALEPAAPRDGGLFVERDHAILDVPEKRANPSGVD
jgi:hypothetical protein